MGHNKENRMPLWVMPREKVSPKMLMDAMRVHYEGTKMDMTTDIGAGGEGCPYRWRPMYFEVDGVEYCNERATATQQTGFWLVGQARPEKVGILCSVPTMLPHRPLRLSMLTLPRFPSASARVMARCSSILILRCSGSLTA